MQITPFNYSASDDDNEDWQYTFNLVSTILKSIVIGVARWKRNRYHLNSSLKHDIVTSVFSTDTIHRE